MDMLKSKEGLVAEIQTLRVKLKNSRDQNSILSDQLLLLQKECKNLLNSISTYEDSNHKLVVQGTRLNEKNIQLKKKLKQSIAACSEIKKQAESYISSIQSRFYEQMSRVNTLVKNKKDTEENETNYSINSFPQQNPFVCDSPAISVSERENDSSIAIHENEEIILAYTQEIKEKQNEISALSRNLEQKTYDIDNFKSNFQGLKENYEKRIIEKDRIIYNLQQEIKNLNEEIMNYKRTIIDGIEYSKLGQSASEKNIQGIRYTNEESHTIIENLQMKVANQAKKFDNYIRTIANLEKQVQLQMIKYSDLENSYKSISETLQTIENEKKELLLLVENSEKRMSELEMLKIQQAKVINEQSAKLSGIRSLNESQGILPNYKKKIETLEEENQKLIEKNEYFQKCFNEFKSSNDNEINDQQKEEMLAKIAELEKQLKEKNQKINETNPSDIIKNISTDEKNLSTSNNIFWKEVHEYLINEFKEESPEVLLEKLKDLNNSITILYQIYEDLDEHSHTGGLTELKNIIAESKLIKLFLDEFAIAGKSLGDKLETLSDILKKIMTNSDYSAESSEILLEISCNFNIKQSVERLIKDFSNNNLSLITKISNSIQKLNLRVGNILEKFKESKQLEDDNEKSFMNQIKDYEITTVNECSEIDDESGSEDYEFKVEMSAKRIKELTEEIIQLNNLIERKDDAIHSLQMKNSKLSKEKEKKIKECYSLENRAAELENNIKTNQEMYEISDKKKTNMITALENRINSMKKDYESLKNSIVFEKDELFDHIIRIEQESKNQVIWYKSQIEDMKKKIKQYENTFNSIEEILGNDFNGDYVESIKNISKKKRKGSMSFNIFRKSSTKSERGSKNNTPTSSEVLSPSESTTTDNIKLQQSLEQEKLHNSLNCQQIEALRENIRHMEFENSKNTDSKIYQNLRTLTIEVIKMLPIM